MADHSPIEEQDGPRDPWAHRYAHPRCRSCMWYTPKYPGDRTCFPELIEVGRCRRHAPTNEGFPVVTPVDWCGDHRVNENAER